PFPIFFLLATPLSSPCTLHTPSLTPSLIPSPNLSSHSPHPSPLLSLSTLTHLPFHFTLHPSPLSSPLLSLSTPNSITHHTSPPLPLHTSLPLTALPLTIRSGGRVRIRPRESVHISPVDPSDAGIYQCAATYATDYAHDHSYVTLGAAAPQLVYRFIEQTLQPGPAVSLKCIATGTPTPHISWTLDGFPLPHSHRYLKGQYVSAHGDVISHVNISSVHVTDGGTYTCSGENSAGRVVHSARLNVYGPPHVRDMGQVSAVAGQTFSVTCPCLWLSYTQDYMEERWSSSANQPPSTSTYQRDLVVEQVTREADKGQYSCTASTKGGHSDTQTLTVRVMVAPVMQPFHFEENLQAGDRAGVACVVTKGDPPITFTWRRTDGRWRKWRVCL
ncbi:hypothetical protein Pcinc_023027, partial [Petrolisthes cinctipes]